jgi:hypothetical protein
MNKIEVMENWSAVEGKSICLRMARGTTISPSY